VEIIWLKGEGGSVRRYAEPLHKTIAERVAAGTVTRVNEDGTPYVEGAEPVKLTAKEKLQAAARELGVDDSGTVPEITERVEKRRALLAQAAELGVDATGTDEEITARVDAKLAE
jgi:hypothetical protein